jgi:hypothetical protein
MKMNKRHKKNANSKVAPVFGNGKQSNMLPSHHQQVQNTLKINYLQRLPHPTIETQKASSSQRNQKVIAHIITQYILQSMVLVTEISISLEVCQ